MLTLFGLEWLNPQIVLRERQAVVHEIAQARLEGRAPVDPGRMAKCKRSMARIQVVLGERSRVHKAAKRLLADEAALIE